MSLIVDCRFCGERISLRKMPHGKHVPFDVHTDDQHKCTQSKSKKKVVKKKETKSKKNELKKTEKVFKEEDYSIDEDNFETNQSASQDIFKDDTLETLKNEIEVETTEKKDKKIIYVGIVLGILALVFYLN